MIKFRTKYFTPFLVAVVILIFTGFSSVFSERSRTDFLTMEGNRLTHHFEETGDSLSGHEIFELQDADGIPIWFGRNIHKDVCISGECKMVHLWLFWDGAGNYLGLQTPENEPLTKSDHTLFEPEDYEKIEEILRDTTSILKTLAQDDLIVVPDTIDPYEVDGYTAATQPTLAEVVVKDAVFTCFTLWHTVYGPVQTEIFRLLESRTNREFLEKMFESNNPGYTVWAINSLKKHPEFHAEFNSKVLHFIQSENNDVAFHALSYYRPELLADSSIQQQLVRVIKDADQSVLYEILWKFIGFGQISSGTVLTLLETFSNQQIGVGAYNLILKLIKPEHLTEKEEIVRLLTKLSENENAYVRNLTIKTLDEKRKMNQK